MGWEETSDPAEFWRATSPFLRSRRTELTVPISVVDGLRAHDNRSATPPRLSWFTDEDGHVAAVLVETPPHRPVVSALPTTAVVALAAHREPPARLLGPAPTVPALAAAWGARHDVEMTQRLHRLGRLTPPATATPTRVAGPADAAAVWDMVRDFHHEVAPENPPPGRAGVEDGLSEGRYVLAMAGDAPVSLAAVTPTALGVARIGPVYTPPAHRGRGHAASATSAAVRLARDRHADEIVLFTDLANPTSNALYARLGFVGVADLVDVALVPGVPEDVTDRRSAPG